MSTIKKLLNFLLVGVVFSTNVLILITDKENIGFGNMFLAITGLIVGFTGLFIWFWGFISLKNSFSVFARADTLVKSGIYRYLKHPIYIGMGMAFTGLSIAKGSILALLFTLIATIPLNIFRAKKEEKLLAQKFGEKY